MWMDMNWIWWIWITIWHPVCFLKSNSRF